MQNKSLKDNILFGQSLNDRIYNKVIDACALKTDFQMLPGGDDTEIGEKVFTAFKNYNSCSYLYQIDNV